MTIDEMISKYGEQNQVDSWETVTLLYEAAVKQVETKIEILSRDFQLAYRYNPIEHVRTRVKTPEGIVNKLIRYEKDVTIENAVKYIKDIAGARIICSFTSDIYRLAEALGNQDDVTILSIKDYIREPKESGYRSYHMVITVPVYLSSGVVETPIEVQIRTIAMDFWASLEHKLNYKLQGEAPDYIKKDLKSSAKLIKELDDKMMEINNSIEELLSETE